MSDERQIDQIQLDFRFGLTLDDGTLVIIEGPFTVEVDDVQSDVTPQTTSSLAPALDVLHRTVTSIRALRAGSLHVTLIGGRIDVLPPDRFENWQVLFKDGSQFVGLPGGNVAVFPSRND